MQDTKADRVLIFKTVYSIEFLFHAERNKARLS